MKKIIFLLFMGIIFQTSLPASEIFFKYQRINDQGNHEGGQINCQEMSEECIVIARIGEHEMKGKMAKEFVERQFQSLDRIAKSEGPVKSPLNCAKAYSKLLWDYERTKIQKKGEHCTSNKIPAPQAVLMLEKIITEAKLGPAISK